MFQCFFSYRIPKYTNKVVDLRYYSMTRTIILYQTIIQFHKNYIYHKLLLILLKYRVYILYYKYNKNPGCGVYKFICNIQFTTIPTRNYRKTNLKVVTCLFCNTF